MMKNILFIHGGAPTAVINASLYGAIIEARNNNEVDRILAAARGTGGLLKDQIIDLTDSTSQQLEILLHTPGSAIGTGRDHLEAEHYATMKDILLTHDVGYVLMTGGNGTMDTCRKLAIACEASGIKVCGIPKTMDNDLSKTDHSPGFASAARYLAGSVAEAAQDVKGLAIHVVVIESFGRDSGWLTASSVLARKSSGEAPHMILCPENSFDEEEFLSRIKRLYEEKQGVVVVASEGLRYADGSPIVEPIYEVGRSTYFGDVSSHLAQLITKKLGIKARSEKPGILGRASARWMSSIDRDEAIQCGRKAVTAVTEGKTAMMASIVRDSDSPYASHIEMVKIDDSVIEAKRMREIYFSDGGYDISEAFRTWLSPLIEPELEEYVSFLD